MDHRSKSEQAALTVAQDAVGALLNWAGMKVAPPRSNLEKDVVDAVERAKQLLGFEADDSKIGALRLLFDDVKLPDGKGKTGEHWWPMGAIANELPKIPYPVENKPDSAEYKGTIKRNLASPFKNAENWAMAKTRAIWMSHNHLGLLYLKPN